ncbi:MAG: DUF4135 domain-containing protein [Desulfobacteraceae bacterium]|nr:DUF4135 domain-containing protein [Desulfobacteraceae bacterium]
MTGIEAYQRIVNSNTGNNNKLLLNNENLRAQAGCWSCCLSAANSNRQNKEALKNFKRALRKNYGDDIAMKINREILSYNNEVGLTVGNVRNALQKAPIYRENSKVLTEFKSYLVKCYGTVIAEKVIDDFPDNIKNYTSQILPNEREIALNRANELTGDSRAVALQNYQAALDEKSQAKFELSIQESLLVNNAMNALQPECNHRQNLYKIYFETALAKAAPAVLQSVADGHAQALMNSIAQQMAEKLDEWVLEAVYQYAVDTGWIDDKVGATQAISNYMDLIDQIGSGYQNKLTFLGQRYPNLMRHLSIEAKQLGESIAEAANRATNDFSEIKNNFFEGKNPEPTGIKDIHITSSDPHHDGRRVMILSYDGHTDNKVVYKPRDIRIDAKLVGSNNPQDIGQSIGSYVDGLLGDDLPMPTYKFLAKSEQNRDNRLPARYGYVQHLSFGSDDDNQLTHEEAKSFYRNFGRQAALFTLLGICDLHQTNIFVSGKEPVFTDLEIGFQENILKKLLPQDGGKKAKNVQGALANTLLFKALTGNEEIVRIPRATVKNDQLTNQRDAFRGYAILKNVTENLVKIDNSSNRVKETRAKYAGDIQDGFKEVLDVLALEMGNNPDRIESFLDQFQGMNVRYHPIITGKQLQALDHAKKGVGAKSNEQLQADYDSMANFAINERSGREVPIELIHDNLISAWENHDVAYFTNPIGSKELMFNGTETVQTGMGQTNTDYFKMNNLDSVKQIFEQLPNETYLEDLKEKGGGYLAHTMKY